MGVNNLSRVVAWRCTSRESNPGPLDLESDTLTTTPPSHPDADGKFVIRRTIYLADFTQFCTFVVFS